MNDYKCNLSGLFTRFEKQLKLYCYHAYYYRVRSIDDNPFPTADEFYIESFLIVGCCVIKNERYAVVQIVDSKAPNSIGRITYISEKTLLSEIYNSHEAAEKALKDKIQINMSVFMED